ncbi:alpha/beta fold hydrolase [Brevibacillus nitrificans]|uniref:Alpha/beta fold hydrolase n=1 Tax=Brevibacillus nitrificans TaxID=651560 RepID=A0A3M8DM44_9BACL|nr:alpha/beta fold hydrolase [Brevibacillus nitrificans]RNB89170.1 alpha/beta fold hydrolase [Brevibacillus nitrificans]
MTKIPLILLAGTLCNSLLWQHQKEHLSDIAEIFEGDVTRDRSIQAMASTVLRQAPEQFALAGLSMGGIVAMEIMRQAPERVKKLALLDTNAYPPRSDQISNWERFIQMAKNDQFIEITTRYLLPGLLHPQHLQNKQLVETVIQMADSIGPEAMINQMTALMTKPDARDVLTTITCPTLVATGREDASCPLQAHQEMADLIPQAKLVIFEQCGHLSTLEQPQAVTAVLRYWLLQ